MWTNCAVLGSVLGVTSYKLTDYSNDITNIGNEVK